MDTKKFLSITFGVCFAVMTYLITSFIIPDIALLLAILSGLCCILLLHIILTITEKQMNKKYSAFEKEIKSPIFLKANGNFNVGNKAKNGNMYFCENGIVFVSLDEKPYACDEVLKSEIDKIEYDNIHINVYTTDGRVFLITTSNIKDILNELHNKNWIQYYRF